MLPTLFHGGKIPHLFLVLAILGATNPQTAHANAEDASAADACPMWLAPSNLNSESSKPRRAGLFAGKGYAQNSTLPFSELAVPVVDFFGDFHRTSVFDTAILSFLEDQLWTPEFIGSRFEGNLTAPALIPGVGILANYHSGYSNADFLQASVFLREQLWPPSPDDDDSTTFPVPGEAHPMRGAITTYFNATLVATEAIPRGMEIFANFGDVWDGNFTENMYQDKIYRYDYEIADKLVNGLVEFYEQFPDLTMEMKEDIMDFMLSKVLGVATGADAKTVNSLIPANPRKLKSVQEAGGTFMYRYRDMIKSTKWLEQNGFCLDAIRSGVSSIPNAGRGAFATRNLRKGETITITPMMHIADKDLLTMYPILETTNETTGLPVTAYDKEQGPIGKQLLMNYAFGHPESSMLLVPVGPQVTLINNGQKGANAHITWTTKQDPLPNWKEALHKSVDEMAALSQISLTMKIVARRTILEGEEITLDYGTGWQEMWESYQAEWEQSKAGKPHPLKAEDMRLLYKEKPLETSESLKENPYPEKVDVACFLRTKARPDGILMTHQELGWDILQFAEPSGYDKYDGSDLYIIAEIMDRKEAPDFFFNYTVRFGFRADPNKFQDVMDVPHAACTFVDQPYSSDVFTPGAFRHPIGIPDSVFPTAWMNLR